MPTETKYLYSSDPAANRLAKLTYELVCANSDAWNRKALTALIFGSRTESDVQYFSRRINPADEDAIFPAPALIMLAHLIGPPALEELAGFFAREADGFFARNPKTEANKAGMMSHIANLFLYVGQAGAAMADSIRPDSDGGEEITPKEAVRIQDNLDRLKQLIATIEAMLP